MVACRGKEVPKELRKATTLVNLWLIWHKRNRIFRNEANEVILVLDVIVFKVAFWLLVEAILLGLGSGDL